MTYLLDPWAWLNPLSRYRKRYIEKPVIVKIAHFLAKSIATNSDPEWKNVLPREEPPASWFYERFLCCADPHDIHDFHRTVNASGLDPIEVFGSAIEHILEGRQYTADTFIERAYTYYKESQ